MQLVNDPRSTPVANLESALKQRRTPALMLNAQLRRFAKQLVAVHRITAVIVAAARIGRFTGPDLLEDIGFLHRNGRRVAGRRTFGLSTLVLRAIPMHQPLGVVTRQIRALQTHRF